MILLSSTGGFLGHLVAQRLVRFNHPVAVLAAHPEEDPTDTAWTLPGLQVRDAANYSQHGLRHALGDVQTLLLMGRGHRVDEVREAALLEAAGSVGVNHVVRVSMAGAHVDAKSAVLRRHGLADEALRQSGLRHTILFPTLYYQDLLEFAVDVRAGTDLLDPMHGARVPYVDVRDVADCAASVLTQIVHRGEEHTLTGPRAWSLAEVAELLGFNVGHPVRARRVDLEWFAQHLRQNEHNLDAASEIAMLLASQKDTRATDSVSRLTGMPPRPLEAFLLDHRGVFMGSGSGPWVPDEGGLAQPSRPVTWRS